MKFKNYSRCYLICNKNKKRLIKEKLRALQKKMIFVDSLYEADQVLVIGDINGEMEREISYAKDYRIDIEKFSDNELDTLYLQDHILHNELDVRKYSRDYDRGYEF